jgi:uncharacterized protein (DUF2236 family)
MTKDDHGLFGPESASWQVHREVTVLFGGARALLMHAAHPLVVAGARDTGFYERNPWKRLQRTLMLTYGLTFGSERDAIAAADRINEIHARVHGIDAVTGLRYDALDPDLLLWVHATLVDSALLFEELTVGRLDEAGRQRFHREQMAAAELLHIPRERIPPTISELRTWIDEVVDSGILRVTEASQAVADLFWNPPAEAEWRPVLRAVSRWAFGTLPPSVREMYGVRWGTGRELGLRASMAGVRAVRPLLPSRYRFIAPYQEWMAHNGGPQHHDIRVRADRDPEPSFAQKISHARSR